MAGSVLLLEDDAAVRDLLQDLVVEEGLTVTICASRAELQAAIDLGTSDVALVDAWGRSHLELSDSERQELIEVADSVPTILFTARSWATRATADELHMLAIVPKPGDVYGIARLVRQAADAVEEMKTRARRLREARRHSIAARDSAQELINESWVLLQAVRARLGDRSCDTCSNS